MKNGVSLNDDDTVIIYHVTVIKVCSVGRDYSAG